MTRRWLILLAFMMAMGVGGLLRFVQLGTVPHGLTWDEAAIGYNGYAVATTRRDEWQSFLPISFRSFGDYKAPLAIYLSGISTLILGISPVSIRLPFATAGVLSLLGTALLIYEWSRAQGWSSTQARTWGVIAAWIMATTPWHVHFSRIGFESGLALCCVIWGVFGFFRWYRSHATPWLYLWWGAWSVGGFVASMYAYHSAKVFMPLFGLGLVWWSRKKILAHRGLSLILLVLTLTVLTPLAYDNWFGKGAARLAQTSIFSQAAQESTTPPFLQLLQNLLAHVDLRFLFAGATTTLRHGDGLWGVFLPILILPLFAGIWACSRSRRWPTQLALWWLLAGLVPASIGFEVPHSNRALLAFPGFLMVILLGSRWLLEKVSKLRADQHTWGTHGERQMLSRSLIGTTLLLYAICTLAYSKHYFSSFAKNSGEDFLSGYWEVFAIIHRHPEIAKVRMTNTYGQPYIYALASSEMSPYVYQQQGGLNKYDFVDKVVPEDAFRANTIIVGTPAELDPPANAEIVRRPDGTPRFIVIINP